MRRHMLLAAAAYRAAGGATDPLPETAINFNGTTQYLTIGSPSAVLDPSADYTVMLFVRPNAITSYQGVFSIFSTDTQNSDGLYLDDSGHLYVERRINGSDVHGVGTNPVTAAAWNCVTLMRRSDALEGYKGNVLEATVTQSGNFAAAATTMVLATTYDHSGGLAGGVFAMKAWSAALSTAQLASEAAQILPVRMTNLWGNYVLSGPSDLVEREARHAAWTATGTPNTVAAPALPWAA